MIATQVRETIQVRVDPSITAKAATLAAEAGNKTTANILEDWIEAKMREADQPQTPTKATR